MKLSSFAHHDGIRGIKGIHTKKGSRKTWNLFLTEMHQAVNPIVGMII